MKREDIHNLLDAESIESSVYLESENVPLQQLVKWAIKESLEHERVRESIRTDRLTAAK